MVDDDQPVPDPLGLIDIDLRETQLAYQSGSLSISKIIGNKQKDKNLSPKSKDKKSLLKRISTKINMI